MEKIISVYWFAILIIVAGGIAFMVLNFYGKPYDVREIEANILIGNIADCISSEGMLAHPIGDQDLKGNFPKICHLNFNSEEEEVQYYISLDFYDFNNQNQLLDSGIKGGNINFKDNPNKNSFYSATKSLYVLNKEGQEPKEILVNITAIIKKEKQNG